MQRYFSDKKNNNIFILNDNDSYHIKKVMRMNISDKIEIVHDKKLYICEINSFDPVEASIIESKEDYNESDVNVILVQSMVNEQKMDLILQKATELGVYKLVPYKAVNCVVKENDKINKKVSRWQFIVKEASEQSKRNIIPEVSLPVSLSDLCKMQGDIKMICSVNQKTKNIKKCIQGVKGCATIILVIGPEGGFDPKEEETLMENGFISTSLGSRVLRTETAGICALSMINYEMMR